MQVADPRIDYPDYPPGSVVEIRVHGVGGCDSDLIISREDKITGNAALHETLVTVGRVDGFGEVRS